MRPKFNLFYVRTRKIIYPMYILYSIKIIMCVVQSSQAVEGILSAKQYLKLNLARITDGVFMLLFCCNIYDFPLRIYNIKQSHRKTGPTQQLLKQTNHHHPLPWINEQKYIYFMQTINYLFSLVFQMEYGTSLRMVQGCWPIK